jgi:hypothetical protein
MAIRVYIIPPETLQMPSGGMRRGPKYFSWPIEPEGRTPLVTCNRASTDYGLLDTLIEVANVTTAQHNAIVANADVTALPANLNTTIGAANLAAVQAALEARNIPAEWITAAMTYRTVLRAIAALFLLAQRYHGLYLRSIIESGYTLNSTIGDLPVAARQRLNDMAQSFGFDTSSITLATTIRQALRMLFVQWTAPIHLGLGVEL